jgi:dihydropteroate synthase
MTEIMGILNVTPDSFSDGGTYQILERAVAHASEMIEDGAAILDVGGESTRPGFTPIGPEEEWSRLAPVLKELAGISTVPISIDTYRAVTAARAIEAGASIINDISGAKDPDMVRVVRESGVKYVFMHNRTNIAPSLPIAGIVEEVRQGVARILDAGIHPRQLIVDPGVGFAKTQAQNMACIRHIDHFRKLGYPVLLGTSRKRVIGNVLNLPVEARLEGSLATVAYALLQGVDFVRVHDVRETARMCRMLEAILDAPVRHS